MNLSLLASVLCATNSLGVWSCNGVGLSASPNVTDNSLGSCTNCVNMSPDQCRAAKNQILSTIDGVLNSCYYIYDTVVGSDYTFYTLSQAFDYSPYESQFGLPDWSLLNYPYNTLVPGDVRTFRSDISNLSYAFSDIRDELDFVTIPVLGSLSSFVERDIYCDDCQFEITNSPSGGDSPYDPTNKCPCAEQITGLRDLLILFKEKLLDYQYQIDKLEYATIGFNSNAVPVETSFSTDTRDWFDSMLVMLKRQNELTANLSYFLSHIVRELKKADTASEESEFRNKTSQIQGGMNSLKSDIGEFIDTDKIEFKDVESYFNFDSKVLAVFNSGSQLPETLYIELPAVSALGFDYSGGTIPIDITPVEPFLNFTRQLFKCLWWCSIATFIIFFFKFFYRWLVMFVKLVAKVFEW